MWKPESFNSAPVCAISRRSASRYAGKNSPKRSMDWLTNEQYAQRVGQNGIPIYTERSSASSYFAASTVCREASTQSLARSGETK